LERHLPKFDKFITVGFLAKFPRDFVWEERRHHKGFGILVYFVVEFPFEFTRTFPELNRIGVVGDEEILKVVENCSGMILEWMRARIKNFLGHVDGIHNNDDLGNIIQRTCLVDATPYSEKFRLRARYEGSVMDSLDEGTIG